MTLFDINSRNTKALKKFLNGSLERGDINKHEHKIAMGYLALDKERYFIFEFRTLTQTTYNPQNPL